MTCIRSACYVILFQGSVEGFTTPLRGLRQGCALSPYIFIICMNVLRLMLHQELNRNNLRGLKLVYSAPTITNVLYADDLLLMGMASLNEAGQVHATLQSFYLLSGQRMSLEKSKLWFSKCTPLAHIRLVIKIFKVGFVGSCEMYLGGPIAVSRPSAFNHLL